MLEMTTVGLDLAKNVFQAHGADASGRAVLRKRLRRDQVLGFFAQLPACVVAMEACGGAHFWGREIGRLGHEVLSPVVYPLGSGSSGGRLSRRMADGQAPREKPRPEGIVARLRRVGVLVSQGPSVAEAARSMGVTPFT